MPAILSKEEFLKHRDRLNFEIYLHQKTLVESFHRKLKDGRRKNVYFDMCQYENIAKLIRQHPRFGELKGHVFPEGFPVLFHQILYLYSPTYARVFDWGLQLKVGWQSTLISRGRFHSVFHPSSRRTKFPFINDELMWALKHKELSEAIDTYIRLQYFNFSFAHEHFHSILSVLIPPPEDVQDWKDYYYFIEALVAAMEWQEALELGPRLAHLLTQGQIIYKSFLKSQTGGFPEFSAETHAPILLKFLFSLHKVSPKRAQSLLGGAYRLSRAAEVGFQSQFVDQDSKKWISKNRKIPPNFKSVNEGKRLVHRKFLFTRKDFGLRELVQPEFLDKFYGWYGGTLVGRMH